MSLTNINGVMFELRPLVHPVGNRPDELKALYCADITVQDCIAAMQRLGFAAHKILTPEIYKKASIEGLPLLSSDEIAPGILIGTDRDGKVIGVWEIPA